MLEKFIKVICTTEKSLLTESEDTKHSKTTIVDLYEKTSFSDIVTHVLVQLEGIVEVEWNRVWDSLGSTLEVREITWFSSGHVVFVGRGGKFRPEF